MSTMSSTVSFRTSYLLQAVRASHHLERVDGAPVRGLVDRDVRELAVARDQLVVRFRHAFHQRPGDALCELDVLGAQAPGAVDSRAPLDGRNLRAGKRHEVTAPRADLLCAVVARGVPHDRVVSLA